MTSLKYLFKTGLWFILPILFALLLAQFEAQGEDSFFTAPEFTLKGEDGKSYSLKDYKGKIVVLEWFNKDCPFVKKHYGSHNMQKLQRKYTEKDIVWFSVISSAPGKQGYLTPQEAIDLKKNEKSFQTRFLFDSDGKVGKSYEAKTTPHMYIIDKTGKLAYQGAIDSIKSYDQEDIKEAQNYVADALDSLLKGQEVKVKKTAPYGCSVKY